MLINYPNRYRFLTPSITSFGPLNTATSVKDMKSHSAYVHPTNGLGAVQITTQSEVLRRTSIYIHAALLSEFVSQRKARCFQFLQCDRFSDKTLSSLGRIDRECDSRAAATFNYELEFRNGTRHSARPILQSWSQIIGKRDITDGIKGVQWHGNQPQA